MPVQEVMLVQEVMPVQEREAPGQMRFAQKEGKVARTLGVMEAGEWKLIVAMALASMLNLQLQFHGTSHYSQNSIPRHRQRLVVEMVLRSMIPTLMIAEEGQFASWCLVSPASRYKLVNLP